MKKKNINKLSQVLNLLLLKDIFVLNASLKKLKF